MPSTGLSRFLKAVVRFAVPSVLQCPDRCVIQLYSQAAHMGLQRRKINQLAEAEDKAAAEIAASHQQRRPAQQPKPPLHVRSPVASYLLSVALACVFWVAMQLLYKYAHHWV